MAVNYNAGRGGMGMGGYGRRSPFSGLQQQLSRNGAANGEGAAAQNFMNAYKFMAGQSRAGRQEKRLMEDRKLKKEQRFQAKKDKFIAGLRPDFQGEGLKRWDDIVKERRKKEQAWKNFNWFEKRKHSSLNPNEEPFLPLQSQTYPMPQIDYVKDGTMLLSPKAQTLSQWGANPNNSMAGLNAERAKTKDSLVQKNINVAQGRLDAQNVARGRTKTLFDQSQKKRTETLADEADQNILSGMANGNWNDAEKREDLRIKYIRMMAGKIDWTPYLAGKGETSKEAVRIRDMYESATDFSGYIKARDAFRTFNIKQLQSSRKKGDWKSQLVHLKNVMNSNQTEQKTLRGLLMKGRKTLADFQLQGVPLTSPAYQSAKKQVDQLQNQLTGFEERYTIWSQQQNEVYGKLYPTLTTQTPSSTTEKEKQGVDTDVFNLTPDKKATTFGENNEIAVADAPPPPKTREPFQPKEIPGKIIAGAKDLSKFFILSPAQKVAAAEQAKTDKFSRAAKRISIKQNTAQAKVSQKETTQRLKNEATSYPFGQKDLSIINKAIQDAPHNSKAAMKAALKRMNSNQMTPEDKSLLYGFIKAQKEADRAWSQGGYNAGLNPPQAKPQAKPQAPPPAPRKQTAKMPLNAPSQERQPNRSVDLRR